MTSSASVSDPGALTQAQRERLHYIDFRLYFLGELKRSDLKERFGIAPAGATRDIALYRSLAAGNLTLDDARKIYVATPQFQPVFEHDPLRALAALTQGYGQALGLEQSLLRCETPYPLNLPEASVLAPVTRAIHRGKAVKLVYYSSSSGKSQREVVPFGMVSNGVRWHVRAFDRKRHEFRDFVFTRMEAPVLLEDSVVDRSETMENDAQWSRLVEMELVPHPQHPRPEVVRRDYRMSEGVLKVKARGTIVGYLLQLWHVDCSPDHSLDAVAHPLWLKDSMTLYGVDNAGLAPGFRGGQGAGSKSAA
jgi:hypothetical protein